ncbi:MAG: putative Ig domain-containing protein [Actinomycetota bacterium]|nr:putative Ig domain-containing protein [Actinomycetota bacterium]
MHDSHLRGQGAVARRPRRRWRLGVAAVAVLSGLGLWAGAGGAVAGAATTAPTFTATGALAGARTGAVAVRLQNGQVLVAGGEDPVGTPIRTAERYNLQTGKWSGTGWLPVPVADATMVRLYNGNVLVAGGLTTYQGNLTATATTAVYNPQRGTFTPAGNLPVASYGASAVLLRNGQVLYAGGFDTPGPAGHSIADAALFNPATGKWNATAALPSALGDSAAAILPSGQALVAGGIVKHAGAAGAVSGATFRYDPASASWQSSPAMPVPVAKAAVTRLASGQVLVVGGETQVGVPSAATQVFHPNGNRWGRFADSPFASFGATATRLGTASVLYAGGATTAAGTPSAGAAIFTVSSGQWQAATSLPLARADANAVSLGSAGVLIFGGLSPAGPTNSTVLFHEVSQPTRTAPHFTSGTSAHGQAGSSLSVTVSAQGNPTPALTESGPLPAGVGFHATKNGTATISGTPSVTAAGTYRITITADNGVGPKVTQQFQLMIAPPPGATGYWYTTSNAEVLFKGSARPIAPHSPQHPRQIVAMAATPDGKGYYLISSFGGVFSYGDARFQGSITALHLRTPTVAFGISPTGHGYYLVTRAGNVFNRGGAPFYGSMAGKRHPPIVAFAVAPDGHGYWLVARNGAVYSFGSAHFYGSKAGRRIPPVVAFAPTPDGHGYWLVTRAGNVFPFGNAHFVGSVARRRVPPVVAFAPTRDGDGYWIVTRAGNVFNFGHARYYGSSAGQRHNGPIVAFAPER